MCFFFFFISPLSLHSIFYYSYFTSPSPYYLPCIFFSFFYSQPFPPPVSSPRLSSLTHPPSQHLIFFPPAPPPALLVPLLPLYPFPSCTLTVTDPWAVLTCNYASRCDSPPPLNTLTFSPCLPCPLFSLFTTVLSFSHYYPTYSYPLRCLS